MLGKYLYSTAPLLSMCHMLAPGADEEGEGVEYVGVEVALLH